jgi:hypothetical protein
MPIQILDHSNFNQTEIRSVVLERLASAPSSPVQGQTYYDTTLNKQGVYNGTSWDYSGAGGVTSVSGTAPIVSSGGSTPAISITPASGSAAGSMSSADFTKLANATNANTNSAIVQRDSSGNFAAGTITATLTGTASNASQLNSQAPSFYIARTNHTGVQAASTISDFDTQVRTSRLDQMAAPSSAVSMNGQRLTGLSAPASGTDAVNQNYVDAAVSTGNNKGTARVVATTNITLATPGATIDGVTMASSDIVLLIGQSAAAENGLYVWSGASSALVRTTNADTSAEVKSGLFVFVTEGTANADNGYTLVTNDPITLGTTALSFIQTSGAGQITAGTGMTKTGNVLNVAAGTGMVANADDMAVDVTVVTRKYTQLIGDGSSVSIAVTHSLNNNTPAVSLQRVSDSVQVFPGVVFTSTSQVTLTFAAAPTSNQYRVTVAR